MVEDLRCIGVKQCVFGAIYRIFSVIGLLRWFLKYLADFLVKILSKMALLFY